MLGAIMPHAAEPWESGKQGEQQQRVRSYWCSHPILRAGPWVVLQNLQCFSNGPVSSIKGLDMLRALVSLSQSGKSVIEAVKRPAVKTHTRETTYSY